MADSGTRYNQKIFGSVDWTSVLIYLVLVFVGWINIYAAVYDESHASIFDMSQSYGKQMMWIGISLAVAMFILLVDDKYYHMLAYPLYWFTILILIAVIFIGKEVNGAKSWIVIGSFALQPTELVKFSTSLALARYMSTYNFSIHRMGSLLRVGVLMGLPALIILLQNDTGSAVVYSAFLFMLYREGFNGWIYVIAGVAIAVFLGWFLVNPLTMLVILFLVCVIAEGVKNGNWRAKMIYISGVALSTIILYLLLNTAFKAHVSLYVCLLVSIIISIGFAVIYAYRNRIRNTFLYIALFFGALLFSFTVNYIFENVMQLHQQKRILDYLGIESDLRGWGWNVNQSKIAIGSGGVFGKGFLNGTQTRYNFVSEQSTDFIFCTVGEEWGFIGSIAVISLFCILILRLMRMGERQQEPFGRIYCYCVASLFLFHVLVNIGMTIGIIPVIGIPLPFFSYGGSSLIAFTLMFFVAVKMDSVKRDIIVRN